jgi:hypothetical protein
MAKAVVMAPVGTGPKSRGKPESPGASVADIKARAAKMRDQGLISDSAHAKLMAKADKVASALGGATGQMTDA